MMTKWGTRSRQDGFDRITHGRGLRPTLGEMQHANAAGRLSEATRRCRTSDLIIIVPSRDRPSAWPQGIRASGVVESGTGKESKFS